MNKSIKKKSNDWFAFSSLLNPYITKYFFCILLTATLLLFSSISSYGNILESLNGRWRIHAQKTEEIQPDQETEIMLYKNVFDRMYIDIKLSARTISFGIDQGDQEIIDIENIVEQGEGVVLYVDHDPILLTPLDGGLLKYEEESNRIFLVLIKQVSQAKYP